MPKNQHDKSLRRLNLHYSLNRNNLNYNDIFLHHLKTLKKQFADLVTEITHLPKEKNWEWNFNMRSLERLFIRAFWHRNCIHQQIEELASTAVENRIKFIQDTRQALQTIRETFESLKKLFEADMPVGLEPMLAEPITPRGNDNNESEIYWSSWDDDGIICTHNEEKRDIQLPTAASRNGVAKNGLFNNTKPVANGAKEKIVRSTPVIK